MRGTRVGDVLGGHGDGIIPAYAGNTCRTRCRRRSTGDHPRVCGEHTSPFTDGSVRTGSSPRMRGTRAVGLEHVLRAGIIPAYAGNTRGRRRPHTARQDHPRVCGEHGDCFCNFLACEGSSPRMRGTHVPAPDNWLSGGIIPAYAGNTRTPSATVTSSRDHPRVCGEHLELSALVSDVLGSSPRMRGTRLIGVMVRFRQRIIPAYAGNTKPT